MPKNENNEKLDESVIEDEEPEVEENDAKKEEEPLSTKSQILKDLNENNDKVKNPGILQRIGAAIFPNSWSKYGTVKSRANTLNKMQYVAGETEDLNENFREEAKENGSRNPYKYQRSQAFNRYHQLDAEYDKIPLWKRVLTRLLPDSWTHAGRCRKYMGMCKRIMEGDSGLNPYTKEEIGSTKNKDGSQKTDGEMLLDGYKTRYNNLNNEYNKLSRFQRFMSHILPNSWTKGGELRNKIEENDEKLKDFGFTDEDCKNIKNMEDEKTEGNLKKEVPENEVNKIVEEAGGLIKQADLDRINKNIEEARKAGADPDSRINESENVEIEKSDEVEEKEDNIIHIEGNNVDKEENLSKSDDLQASQTKKQLFQDKDKDPTQDVKWNSSSYLTNADKNEKTIQINLDKSGIDIGGKIK